MPCRMPMLCELLGYVTINTRCPFVYYLRVSTIKYLYWSNAYSISLQSTAATHSASSFNDTKLYIRVSQYAISKGELTFGMCSINIVRLTISSEKFLHTVNEKRIIYLSS
jgi:hypothetical protein